MSNLLIVESENDQYFIEALVARINVHIKIDSPVCLIDEYECLGGISKLENKLNALKSQVLKEGIDKIGIIFDADEAGVEQRTQQIQEKIDLVFGESPELKFSIFILNKDGQGELETLLKAIKSQASPMADCLEAWQACFATKNKALKQKDFDKFWIQVYQRYDCCTNQEQKQAGRKCSNEVSLKNKSIYDYDQDIPELNELKDFLRGLGGCAT
ncbi:MAG: hypothetical protein K9L22_09315 [Methylococcaceae bacterium]|nr:hypothetical protein [Methylococcaceae bacterium]